MGLVRDGRTRRCAVLGIVLALLSATAPDARGQDEPDQVAEAGCTRIVPYDGADFSARSHEVVHRYLPMRPGTQRVFEGRSDATGEVLPHRVTFTVTGLTKVIDGVRAAVIWDVDESDDQLLETELAFFAQDQGRVWNLGEYPEEYPDGVFQGAPSTWIAGIEDAEPGVHMRATPVPGRPEYVQGSVPSIEFLDCAKVVESNARTCVPAGCFSNVVITHERSPLDPAGGVQVKYHAPGVGIVQIGALNDPEAETLVMTEFNRLSPAELREANRQARILDQRGRQCSDIYSQTTPLEGPDDGDFGPYTCAPDHSEAPQLVTGATAPAFAPPAPPPAPAAAIPANPVRGGYFRWVDHPLLPLLRVRAMVHESVAGDVRRRIESRVRPSRVRLNGVLATVVDSTSSEDGTVVERSARYYAQDRLGNVWSLGETIRPVGDARATRRARRWIAGRKGARRGLLLPAKPKAGRRFHLTRVPGVAAERATVLSTDTAVATAAGRFTGCLRTRVIRRGASVRRVTIHCPGVGLVREQSRNGTVELTAISRLGR